MCVVAGGGFCVGLLRGGGVCAAGDGGVCYLRGLVGGGAGGFFLLAGRVYGGACLSDCCCGDDAADDGFGSHDVEVRITSYEVSGFESALRAAFYAETGELRVCSPVADGICGAADVVGEHGVADGGE